MTSSDIVDKVAHFFRGRCVGVACAYVFGSEARGQAGPDSDLDVAVLLDEDPPPTLAGSGIRLGGQLETALGRAVDLVVLNRAPVDLVHRILCDGVLAFERDRAARVRFEVRARREYFDLRPVLDEYRRGGRAADGRR